MGRSNRFLLFVSALLAFILLIQPHSAYTEISSEDREILSKIQQDSFNYFVRMSDKNTGLTRDSSKSGSPASTAATGFSLASVAIGGSKGWIPEDYAKKQIRKTLNFLLNKADHKNGFYYHFLDSRTGKRVWGSEASSIDTALLVAGALLAAQFYPGSDIERMAHQLYDQVDWTWMMNGSKFICMGWKPETGFLPYYWDSYSEHLILQALAIGAKKPVPSETWTAWLRPQEEYRGHNVVYSGSGSLFTYQFSQAFIDFRKLNDAGINYFDNSREASLANYKFSLAFREEYQGYSENSWGLSASVGPGGYKAYGARPGGAEHDGTVAPYAAISSINFTPEESIRATKHFYSQYQSQLYGMFGFKDAFNIDKNWFAEEYLGIDQGITVLSLENFLNQNDLTEKFMRLDFIKNWIKTCGLE